MSAELYLSVPANRELVRSVVSRVLLMLEPSGTELKLGYLEPLIDLAVKSEVIVADLWDEAGRFGNLDLFGPVVVPLVIGALTHNKLEVTREEVRRAVRSARSSQGIRHLHKLEQAINMALEELGAAEDHGKAHHAG